MTTEDKPARVAWTVELDVELAEQVRAVARALGLRPRRALPLLARHGLKALDQVEDLRAMERSEGR